MKSERLSMEIVQWRGEANHAFGGVPTPKVEVEFSLISGHSDQFSGQELNEVLRVDFSVIDAKLNVKASLPKDQPAMNLWDSDVCEIFLSTAQDESAVASAPYFEFQISPLGQYFELKIIEPRKQMDFSFRSGLRYGATVLSTNRWTSWIELPLKSLGLDPTQKLFGNAYACLLREPHRIYLSAFHSSKLITKGNADFHLPQHFAAIVL